MNLNEFCCIFCCPNWPGLPQYGHKRLSAKVVFYEQLFRLFSACRMELEVNLIEKL